MLTFIPFTVFKEKSHKVQAGKETSAHTIHIYATNCNTLLGNIRAERSGVGVGGGVGVGRRKEKDRT